MKQHKVTHSSEREEYDCNDCEKSFKTVQGLKYHEMVHRGDKPFSCSVCDKSFKTAGQLKNHISVHMTVKGASKHSNSERG